MLNIDKFVEQYHQIEIFGPQQCTQAYFSNEIFFCSVSNYEENIIDYDCEVTKTSLEEEQKFGFGTKVVLKLKNALQVSEIPFADNQMIQCFFHYDRTDSFGLGSVAIKLSNQFDYVYNSQTAKLEKSTLDVTKQHSNMMKLWIGVRNTMVHRVNEIQENFIQSNG